MQPAGRDEQPFFVFRDGGHLLAKLSPLLRSHAATKHDEVAGDTAQLIHENSR
jgi:hypothetical protein